MRGNIEQANSMESFQPYSVYQAVQEQSIKLDNVKMPQMILLVLSDCDAQFTDFNGMGGLGSILAGGAHLQLKDCLVGSGLCGIECPDTAEVTLVNNLWERASLNLWSDYPTPVSFYNNTVRNSTVAFYSDYPASWSPVVRDNLFDHSAVTASYPQDVTHDHNAYCGGATQLAPYHTGDFSTAVIGYAAGPLGNRYIGTAWPVGVADAGSRSAADAGLSGYTITADNVPDTGTVDVGFHYFGMDFPVDPAADYWLTFPTNYANLSLFISSPTANYVLVFIGGTLYADRIIEAGTVGTVDIPVQARLSEYDGVDGADGIETNGIHVIATAPVSIYGLDRFATESAAFIGYSKHQLGTSYCLMAYMSQNLSSQLAIVATDEGTTHVTITPSATANLVGHTQVDLLQGQTYQAGSMNPDDDVTGTVVTSDKPIAVFAGAFDAFVPYNQSSANPLVQEQLPTGLWGQDALAIPFAGRIGDAYYRVLAANDGTDVFINGTKVATLDAGECYPPAGQDAVAIGGRVTFHGSEPIQVAQFAHGYDDDDTGDPLEILLPSVSRWLTSYIVATAPMFVPGSPYDGSFDQQFLNLIVPTAAKTTTYINGVRADTLGTFQQIQSSGYWGVQIPVDPATTYTVTSPQPMTVQVYGWGNYDSYGYSGN